MTRAINAAGRALVKHWEGTRLTTYRDGGGVPTIGVGHTGPDVHTGMTITPARVEQLFEADLVEAAAAVDRLAPHTTDNQRAALTAFTFNLGAARLAHSTLLREHNAGRYASAAAHFRDWVYDNHKVVPGLVNRRAAERALYEKEDA